MKKLNTLLLLLFCNTIIYSQNIGEITWDASPNDVLLSEKAELFSNDKGYGQQTIIFINYTIDGDIRTIYDFKNDKLKNVTIAYYWDTPGIYSYTTRIMKLAPLINLAVMDYGFEFEQNWFFGSFYYDGEINKCFYNSSITPPINSRSQLMKLSSFLNSYDFKANMNRNSHYGVSLNDKITNIYIQFPIDSKYQYKNNISEVIAGWIKFSERLNF